jgi:hypothetical protein
MIFAPPMGTALAAPPGVGCHYPRQTDAFFTQPSQQPRNLMRQRLQYFRQGEPRASHPDCFW